MIAYWISFFLLSYASVLFSITNLYASKISSSSLSKSLWFLAFFMLLFFVGLRHSVGGDWQAYIRMLDVVIAQRELNTHLMLDLVGDPGYQLLIHLSMITDTGIYGANFVSALIFLTGLFYFSSNLPKPMLAIAIAFPYLVLIVGMGYTRQSIGIGIIMMALIFFMRENNLKFIFLVIAAASFHKSAAVFLGLLFFSTKNFSILKILSILLFLSFVSLILLAESLDRFLQHYVLEEYKSEGAFIRLLMNALVAVGLLARLDHFGFTDRAKYLISILAKAAIILFLIYFLGIGEVVLDRISLYLLPLQLIYFSSLSNTLSVPKSQKWIIDIAIIFLYAFVLYVWLNFATHSASWLPYNNIILRPVIYL